MKMLDLLETKKSEALSRFFSRMQEARQKLVAPSAAYLQGMREGYSEGLVDGVKLGLDVQEADRELFESPPGTA